MKVISLTITILLILMVTFAQSRLTLAVDTSRPCKIEAKMEKMGWPKKFAPSFVLASQRTGISPEFLISLSKTESEFRERAISSKGYKGLMQIPFDIYEPDANILIGATIFKEKMRLANGSVTRAIILYKGYDLDSKRGREQADAVLEIYKTLRVLEV